jgi:hypothetical protein
MMCIAVMLAVIGLGASRASALPVTVTIPVADPSFEASVAPDIATTQSPSWVVTPAGLNGVFNPGNAQFAGTSPGSAQGVLPHGGQVGLVEDTAGFDKSTLSQKLGVNVAANTRYDLSVFVGDRADVFGVDYSVQLLAGGVPLKTWINPAVPANGTFQLATMSVTTDASANGELEIRFAARETLFPSATQAFFDSVALTATERSRSITILDPSFEAAPAGDVGTANSPAWSFTPAGFNSVFDPTNGQFAGTAGDGVQGSLPNGGQVGLVEDTAGFDQTTLFQTLSESVIPKGEYTLSFYVGDRADAFNTNYRVQLLAGGTAFLDLINPLTPENGRFELATLVATAPASASGLLTIRFIALDGTSQTFFDDVSLSVVDAAVPEPASAALLGLGLALLAQRRRPAAV